MTLATRPINQTLIHLAGPLAIGVAFLLVALLKTALTCFLLLTGTSTTGHIVGLIRQESVVGPDDGQQAIVVFAPVFVFATADGREFTVRVNAGSNPPAYSVGQPVRVLYRADAPRTASLATFGQLWGLACGFAASGLVLSGAGMALLAWGRSRIRRGLPTTNDEWSGRWAARGMRTPF